MGYADNIIEEAYQKAYKRDRTTLLTPKGWAIEVQKLRIIGQYEMFSNKVKRYSQKALGYLEVGRDYNRPHTSKTAYHVL